MYATTTRRLDVRPGPAFDAATDPARLASWLPVVTDVTATDGRFDRLGAGFDARLATDPRGGPLRFRVTRRIRDTVHLVGVRADGARTELVVSVSPWDGATMVWVAVDVTGHDGPVARTRLRRTVAAAPERLARLTTPSTPSGVSADGRRSTAPAHASVGASRAAV